MSDLKSRSITFLRWSEKYTKTDMVYLASEGGLSVLASIVSLGISALTFLAFANWFSKENYGIYQYILSVADLFGIFVLAGINASISRSTARGKDGSLMEGLFTKIRWGLIGGIGAILLGVYYLIQANTTLGWGFVIAGICIPFWETPGIFGNYLQGKKKIALMAISDVVIQASAALVLIPALFFNSNVLIILFLYLLVNGLALTGFFLFSLWKIPPNAERDPEMIPYGKHLTVISIIGNLASSIDTILVWHLLGPVSVALYKLAQSIPSRANGFLKIINRMAFPKMAAQDPATLRQTLMRKVLFLVAMSTLCALAYIIAAPFIFTFFLPKYIDSIPYTMLAAGLIALQPFSLIASSFTAQAKKKSLYFWSIGAPLMRIALFLALIPLWGIWGAMIGLVGAKALESILLIILFYWK